MNQNSAFLKQMLQTENNQLNKLNTIVQSAIEEETLLTTRLSDVSDNETRKFGERMADRVASFGGSWTFILVFFSVLLVWIALNSFVLLNKSFDPYPYILLNLILSCIAAIQAPVIMMSQNRKEAKDRKRAQNDYLINLKSEIEIRSLHQKMDLAIVDQFKHLCDIQQKQLELLEQVNHKLDNLTRNK